MLEQPAENEPSHRNHFSDGLAAIRRRIEQLRGVLGNRAEVERNSRYYRMQVELLWRMIRSCQRALDEETALSTVIHDVCEHLGWPIGHVYLPRPDPVRADRMVPSGLWHLADPQRYARFREVTERTSFRRGEGLIGRAWAGGKPIWERDIHEDPESKRLEKEPELRLRAALAIPLVFHDRTLAVLEYFTEDPVEPNGMLMETFGELAQELGALAEQKRVAAVLERNAAQYYRELQEVPIPLLVLDAEGRVRFWNRATLEVFGDGADQLKDHPAATLLAERYQSLVRRYLRQWRPEGRPGRRRTLIAEAVMPDGGGREIQAAIRSTGRADEAAYVVLVQDISARRALELRMRREQERLRNLLAEHHTSEQRHREELARTLHEHVAQMLAAAQMQLKGLRDAPSSEELGERMAEVDDVIRRALQDVRHISYDLSPPALHELGLEPAVAWLGRRLDERHGLRLRIDDDGTAKPLTPRARRMVYYAVRELLTNVASHPGAEVADLRMRTDGGDLRIELHAGAEALEPADEPGESQGQMGLLNINEQMVGLGGRMHLDSRPGEGTWVTLVVPLESTGAARIG